MSKVSIKGVLIGGVVDVVSSVVIGIPIAIVALAKVDFAHTPKDQLAAAIAAATKGSTLVFVAQMVFGLACSTLGGYVAGKIAKHDEPLNGALSAFLCVTIGVFTVIWGHDDHSTAVQILMFVLSPVCALLGGYLALQQRISKLRARA